MGALAFCLNQKNTLSTFACRTFGVLSALGFRVFFDLFQNGKNESEIILEFTVKNGGREGFIRNSTTSITTKFSDVLIHSYQQSYQLLSNVTPEFSAA